MISLVSSIDLKAVLIPPAHRPWILLVVFQEDGVSIRNEIKSPKSTWQRDQDHMEAVRQHTAVAIGSILL